MFLRESCEELLRRGNAADRRHAAPGFGLQPGMFAFTHAHTFPDAKNCKGFRNGASAALAGYHRTTVKGADLHGNASTLVRALLRIHRGIQDFARVAFLCYELGIGADRNPGGLVARDLTLRQIGGSIGATLPRDMAERLPLRPGDRVPAVETDRGIPLTPYAPQTERTLRIAARVARPYRNALRELAKSPVRHRLQEPRWVDRLVVDAVHLDSIRTHGAVWPAFGTRMPSSPPLRAPKTGGLAAAPVIQRLSRRLADSVSSGIIPIATGTSASLSWPLRYASA